MRSIDKTRTILKDGTPKTTPHPRFFLLNACLILLVILTGCNSPYSKGQFLEKNNRWEEASIQYHLAIIDDPKDEEYQQAFARANRVVARENFVLYKKFLARKHFKKAYLRLVDAARQDPAYQPVTEEMGKWMRVLVAGKVDFEFDSLTKVVSYADKLSLAIQINTPNPGEVIEGKINLNTGVFFMENLVYDKPIELLAYYSLHSIGLNLTMGRSKIRKFTSLEYRKFINVRTPVLDKLSGSFAFEKNGALKKIKTSSNQQPAGKITYWNPKRNPHYKLLIQRNKIKVSIQNGGEVITPVRLFLNQKDTRLFVDFGSYLLKNNKVKGRWTLARPVHKQNYLARFIRNIALNPYFFYREGVYTFTVGP